MDKRYFKTLRGLLSEKRYNHSLGVSATARELAELYGADRRKAFLAGLLHDCAKDLSGAELLRKARQSGVPVGVEEEIKPSLLHAPVGALVAGAQFGIQDAEILQAIALHTLGSENMTLLDKIIFVADKIEPGRVFHDAEKWRQTARYNLDKALLGCFDAAIIKSIRKGEIIHSRAVQARNKFTIYSAQAGNNIL